MSTSRGPDLPAALACLAALTAALVLPGCRSGDLVPNACVASGAVLVAPDGACLPECDPCAGGPVVLAAPDACPPESDPCAGGVPVVIGPAPMPMPMPMPIRVAPPLRAPAPVFVEAPPPRDFNALMRRGLAARRAALRAEMHDDPACADRFYESAAMAALALPMAPDPLGREARCARDLHNDSLADALRAAGRFGRIEPTSHWVVNGPAGTMTVPVARKGFVWSASDFTRLADPREARANQYQKVCHRREGLGAAQVVVRPNPNAGARDRFLPPTSFFAATAVLRPDPAVWLGGAGANAGAGAGRGDVLELYDPYRVRDVEVAGRPVGLASDVDAVLAMAENAVAGRRYTWSGFLNPTVELSNARVGLIEPYQPGRVVVVFVHGLLDNPYIFSDALADLTVNRGLMERYQVAVFRYPTGNSFLRSASILRRQLREMVATYDPRGVDPGMQNMVLVGYSMGGLISKLQITSSGNELWALAADRPIEAMVAPESTKDFLRQTFVFEPQPFVSRVVYMATPHHGSAWATRMLGRFGSRMVERPADTKAMTEQLVRDNPDAVRLESETLPSSIDLLAHGGPVLEAMQRLPVRPGVQYHTIAGRGYGPEACARGDTVVPLTSASIPGAASELHVRATHFTIYHAEETIAELDRILREHAAAVGVTGAEPVAEPAGAPRVEVGVEGVR